jgi:hypothetical protein
MQVGPTILFSAPGVFMATPLSSAPAHSSALRAAALPTVPASGRHTSPSRPNESADNIVWGTVSEDDGIIWHRAHDADEIGPETSVCSIIL